MARRKSATTIAMFVLSVALMLSFQSVAGLPSAGFVFRGSLRPSIPLSFTGALEIEETPSRVDWILGSPTGERSMEMQGSFALLAIHERRQERLGPDASMLVSLTSSSEEKTTFRRMMEPRLTLAPVGSEAGPAWTDASQIDFRTGGEGHCTLGVVKLALAAGEMPLLNATCQALAASGSLQGTTQIRGGTLRAEFRDADTGENEILLIEAGQERSNRSDRPATTTYIQRNVTIHDAQGMEFHFTEGGSLSVQSSAMLVAGELRIPSATGSMEWGTHAFEERFGPVSVPGVFALAPGKDGDVQVEGRAWKGPNSPIFGGANMFAASMMGTAIVAAVGALGYASLRVWRKLLPWTLFTRIVRHRALENPTRSRILDAVRENPGLNLTKLAMVVPASSNALRHHVGVLLRQGVLTSRRFGRELTLFVPGSAELRSARAWVQLRHPNSSALLRLLSSEPTLRQHVAARRLGISQTQVSYLVRRLARLGLLRIEREGRARRYWVQRPAE